MSAPTTPDLLALDRAAQDLLFRAAHNTFTDEPVTDAKVAAIHDLIRYGPTAYNGQPLRVLLLRSPAARPTAAVRLQQQPGQDGRRSVDRGPSRRRGLPPTAARAVSAPSAGAGLAGGRAARVEQARFNATLQIGYLIVGVRAAGLAAGPMAGFDAAGVRREFFPDGRHEVLLLLNLGHPGREASHERLPRLDTGEVFRTLDDAG
ncbi:nitroreductase family protein [Micromonospora zamorensis]|uniref:nitroreductase family protein n=1 Tax=Micromonospora zamorensis TaxID=709883 RepID=UPI0037975008